MGRHDVNWIAQRSIHTYPYRRRDATFHMWKAKRCSSFIVEYLNTEISVLRKKRAHSRICTDAALILMQINYEWFRKTNRSDLLGIPNIGEIVPELTKTSQYVARNLVRHFELERVTTSTEDKHVCISCTLLNSKRKFQGSAIPMECIVSFGGLFFLGGRRKFVQLPYITVL